MSIMFAELHITKCNVILHNGADGICDPGCTACHLQYNTFIIKNKKMYTYYTLCCKKFLIEAKNE